MVDIAPEGITFIASDENRTGKNMLLVSNELSGTTTIYEIWDFTSGSETPEQEHAALRIFPNPATDIITLSGEGLAMTTIHYTITSTSGQIMDKGVVDAQKGTIQVSSSPAGIYFVSLFDGKSTVINRHVKR